MFDTHFGMTATPFDSKAQGAAVFNGSQQSVVCDRLRRALAAKDAIVTITGPVGVGKTTLVNHALATLSPGRKAAWIGRMSLAPEEVLTLLLAGFGIQQPIKGKISRFAAFRRILQKQAQTGVPVAIIVEDAARLGVDTLAELEAMTAADTSDETGANLILMGQPGMQELLSSPELARLRQRNRLRQVIEPLSLAETSDYIDYAISTADGDADLFSPESVQIIHDCSAGVPRIINTLCASALQEAALHDKAVSSLLVADIAREAFDFDAAVDSARSETDAVEHFEATELPDIESTDDDIDEQPEQDNEVSADVANSDNSDSEIDDKISADDEAPEEIEDETTADAIEEYLDDTDRQAQSRIEDSIIVESGCYPEPDFEQMADAPEETVEPEQESKEPDSSELDEEIPELIEDTQPELRTLNVEALDSSVDGTVEPVSEEHPDEQVSSIDDTDVNIPVLSIDEAVNNATTSVANELPELSDEDMPVVSAADSEELQDEEASQAEDEERAAELRAEEEPQADDEPGEDTLRSEDEAQDVEESREEQPQEVEEPREEEPVEEEPREEVPQVELAELSLMATGQYSSAAIDAQPDPVAEPEAINDEPAAQDGESAAMDFDALLRADDEPDEASFSEEIPATDAVESSDVAIPTLTEDLQIDVVGSPDAETGQDVRTTARPSEVTEETELDTAIQPTEEDDADLDQFAAEIGKANSLEDISDVMAETLFGNSELDRVAAEVSAAAGTLADESPSELDASPVMLELEEREVAANDAGAVVTKLPAAPNSSQLSAANGPAGRTAAPPLPDAESGEHLKESVAMRMEMLKAMKSGQLPKNGKLASTMQAGNTVEAIEMGHAETRNAESSGPKPETIENQIDTSITQTLKAVDIKRMQEAEAAADAQEKAQKKAKKKSGGLFSRFRKSS